MTNAQIPPGYATPTPDEVRQLASLVPLLHPSLPDLSCAAQPFTDLVSQKWLRDFLFTSSPIHVQHMTSPAMQHNALTCLITSTVVNPYAPPSSVGPFELGHCIHYLGYALFVPVFIADQVVCGVGAHHYRRSVYAPGQDSHAFTETGVILRFAHDAKNSTLLIYMDSGEDDFIFFITVQLRSSTASHVLTAIIDRKFCDTITSLDDNVTVSHILPHIIYAQEEVHMQPCVMCERPPEDMCGCPPSIPPPKHPFDRDYFVKGLAHFCSLTSAVGNHVSFEGGQARQNHLVARKMGMMVVDNAEATQRLSRWSVTEFLSKRREDPFHSLIPRQERSLGNKDQLIDCLTLPGNEEDEDSSIQDEIQEIMLAATGSRMLTAGSVGTLETGTVTPSPKYAAAADFGVVSPLQPVESDIDAARENGLLQSVAGDGDENGISGGHEEVSVPSGFVGVVGSGGMEHGMRAPTIFPDGTVRLMPESQNPRELIRELKAQEKRERNRASARKSNLKQKETRQKIRQEMKSNIERIEELRRVEMELRTENIRLRREVERRKAS